MEIAKSDRARFQWWVQKTFQVLPTDPRFLDLTEEQLDLIYEHFILDMEASGNKRKADTEYDKEEQELEQFNDPDFDKVWNDDEEYEKDLQEPIDVIGEKQFFSEIKGEGYPSESPETIDMHNDWEEV